MLQASQKAPQFSSVDQHNHVITLADYAGNKNVILYFYPKDDTRGCTIEARDFTRLADEFARHDTVVIGVSKDDCDSHLGFIDKYGLRVELLADTSGEVCERYGVWQQKEKNGVKKMGIVRSTFVIDKNGILVAAAYGVDPNGHAESMLRLVEKL
jgi:peroxiredoxin Q/BCP